MEPNFELNDYLLITDRSKLEQGEEYYINTMSLPYNYLKYKGLYKLETLTILPNFDEIYYFINIDNINMYLKLDVSRMNIKTNKNANPGYYYELTAGEHNRISSLYNLIRIYKLTTSEYVLK